MDTLLTLQKSEFYFTTHPNQDYKTFDFLLPYFIDNNYSNVTDGAKLWFLIQNIDQIVKENIIGDFGYIGNDQKVLEFYAKKYYKSYNNFDKNNTYAIVYIEDESFIGYRQVYNCINTGGLLVIENYNIKKYNKTEMIQRFAKQVNEYLVAIPDATGSVCMRKTKAIHYE